MLSFPEQVTPSTVILLLVGAYTLLFIGQAIHRLFLSPLRHLPGPKIAAVTDLWGLYQQVKGRKFVEVHKAFDVYGPVVRIGPNEVALADSAYLSQIYQSKLDKHPLYSGFKTHLTDNAFSTLSAQVAAGKRKGMLPHYATANLVNYQDVFESHLQHMTRVIEEVKPGESLDILQLLAHSLIDILGEVVLNHDFGAVSALEANITSGVVRAIKYWPKQSSIKGVVPAWLWFFLSKLPGESWRHLVESDADLSKAVAPLVAKAQREVEEKRIPERPCLIHRLLEARDSFTGVTWETKDVIAECIDHFLAGAETTSTVLSYTLWLLCKHPEVLKKLQAELDSEMESGEVLPLQVTARLPYLNAVLKEGLRLYMPVPGVLPRILPAEGLSVDGIFIPGGTSVGLQTYTIHHDPKIWKADVEAFKPERWLAETPEMKAAFIPFSVGGRNCPGQNLALFDLRLLLSTMARTFDITAADGLSDDLMAPFEAMTIAPKTGKVPLRFTRRSA